MVATKTNFKNRIQKQNVFWNTHFVEEMISFRIVLLKKSYNYVLDDYSSRINVNPRGWAPRSAQAKRSRQKRDFQNPILKVRFFGNGQTIEAIISLPLVLLNRFYTVMVTYVDELCNAAVTYRLWRSTTVTPADNDVTGLAVGSDSTLTSVKKVDKNH